MKIHLNFRFRSTAGPHGPSADHRPRVPALGPNSFPNSYIARLAHNFYRVSHHAHDPPHRECTHRSQRKYRNDTNIGFPVKTFPVFISQFYFRRTVVRKILRSYDRVPLPDSKCDIYCKRFPRISSFFSRTLERLRNTVLCSHCTPSIYQRVHRNLSDDNNVIVEAKKKKEDT